MEKITTEQLKVAYFDLDMQDKQLDHLKQVNAQKKQAIIEELGKRQEAEMEQKKANEKK